MKKLLCLLTSLACMISFAACGSSDSSSSEKASASTSASSSEETSADASSSETGTNEASSKAKESTTAGEENSSDTAASGTEASSQKSDPTADPTEESSASTTKAEKTTSGGQVATSGNGQPSSSSSSDDFDSLFGFEKISVDKSSDTVVIKLPETLFSVDEVDAGIGDDDSIETMIKKYDGVEITKNEAEELVVIKMPKKEYEKFMTEISELFDKSLRESVNNPSYPSITAIKHNDDFSEFDITITTKEEFEESMGGLFFLSLYMEFIFYTTLNGNSVTEMAASGKDISDFLKITIHDKNGNTYTEDDF